MEVTQRSWDSGIKIDDRIRIKYLTLSEIREREEDFRELISKSFMGSVPMPDASGRERFFEILDTYARVPDSHYTLPDKFDPHEYSSIPEFIQAWSERNLEEMCTWAHLAFDTESGKLIGAIFCLPDLYELWLGQPITRANVDTAMVDKDFAGRGIFSSLNNIGRITGEINGIRYFEGTQIWYNNKDAVNSIFPHCIHARTHYVMQKRLKSPRPKGRD